MQTQNVQKAKALNNLDTLSNFKQFKKSTAKEQKRARWQYINNIIQKGLEDNNKFVKAQRQDNFGIPPLKQDGTLHSDSTTKAKIMLHEFISVFTHEDSSFIPKLSGPSFPDIEKLHITQEGAAKLLSSLDASKASGPDNIPCRVLKELALEISPVITSICQQSLELSSLPCDWTEAIISPVYKKGKLHLASNYRPISLTCVVSKIMEHIFCKHTLNHLDKFSLLTSCQHGFRKAHLCETQLLLTVDMRSFDHHIQSDVAILDFSQAFDSVPHERLLSKLEHSVDPSTPGSDHSFLIDRCG